DALAYSRFESLTARIVLTLAFVAPGSFFLGMPFPLKLRSLEGSEAALVPWAWAVNGLASVAGSVLAVALTMNVGFRAVFLLAGTVYLVALAAHLLTLRQAGGHRIRSPLERDGVAPHRPSEAEKIYATFREDKELDHSFVLCREEEGPASFEAPGRPADIVARPAANLALAVSKALRHAIACSVASPEPGDMRARSHDVMHVC